MNSKLNPKPKIMKSSKDNSINDELKISVETGIEIVFESIHDLIEFCEYSR